MRRLNQHGEGLGLTISEEWRRHLDNEKSWEDERDASEMLC